MVGPKDGGFGFDGAPKYSKLEDKKTPLNDEIKNLERSFVAAPISFKSSQNCLMKKWWISCVISLDMSIHSV